MDRQNGSLAPIEEHQSSQRGSQASQVTAQVTKSSTSPASNANKSEPMVNSFGKENLQDQRDFERFCFECNWPLAKSRHLINIDGKVYKWHPECFKCNVCNNPLDKESSCHIYRDKIVCRDDYAKLKQDCAKFCCRCRWPIAPSDWVRRVRQYVYHLACFSCDICLRQLSTGEQFTIDIQGKSVVRILCQRHFQTMLLEGSSDYRRQEPEKSGSDLANPTSGQDTCNQTNRNHEQQTNNCVQLADSAPTAFDFNDAYENGRHHGKLYLPLNQLINQAEPGDLANSIQQSEHRLSKYSAVQVPGQSEQLRDGVDSSNRTLSSHDGSSDSVKFRHHTLGDDQLTSLRAASSSTCSSSTGLAGISGQLPSKSKRVRTTFTEEQLSILQTHFQIDSNPDGQDLERIAAITNLTKRVTQVWFQNSRARQKKYLIKRKPTGSAAGSASIALSASFGNQSQAQSSQDHEMDAMLSSRGQLNNASLKNDFDENINSRDLQYQCNLNSSSLNNANTPMFPSGDERWSSGSSSASGTSSPSISLHEDQSNLPTRASNASQTGAHLCTNSGELAGSQSLEINISENSDD